MPGRKRVIALGCITLLAGLILLFPARAVHHWFSPPGVQLAGIEGTIWSGSAREMTVQGLYLRNLNWRMQPLRLFLGKLAYRIEADPAGGFLETDVAVNPAGTVSFSDLNAAVPIAAVRGLLPNDDIDGDVSLRIAELELRDGWPSAARGEVGVANLLVRAMAPTALGSFRAELQTADGNVVGSVEDVSGMLDVAATLNLNADRSYSLIGQVAPTAEASPSVVQQLRFLGSPDARGLREFRLEGSF